MFNKYRHNGFSLVEILLAVGVLAVGLLLVAGVFPVGIRYTTLMMERSVAPSIADEAFSKIQIYALGEEFLVTENYSLIGYDPSVFDSLQQNLDDPNSIIFTNREYSDEYGHDAEDIFTALALFPFESIDVEPSLKQNLYSWPTTDPTNSMLNYSEKRYSWSALVSFAENYDEKLNPNPPLLITVFVCRKFGNNWPHPILVRGGTLGADNEIRNVDTRHFQEGSYVVDDRTARVYRVTDVRDIGITIMPHWDERSRDLSEKRNEPNRLWVVPPSAGGGNPVIAVYQRVIQLLSRS